MIMAASLKVSKKDLKRSQKLIWWEAKMIL
jgi:hypothetical protein